MKKMIIMVLACVSMMANAQYVSPRKTYSELKEMIETCQAMSEKCLSDVDDEDSDTPWHLTYKSKSLFMVEVSAGNFVLTEAKDDSKGKSMMREYISMYMNDRTELEKHEKYWKQLNSNRKTSQEWKRKFNSCGKKLEITCTAQWKKWLKFGKKYGVPFTDEDMK